MSDALLGVIVGGVIANIGILINFIFEYKKWKREKRIEYLRDKRERLALLFKSLDERILKVLINKDESGDFPRDLVSDIFHTCPKNVSNAFMALVNDMDRKFPTDQDVLKAVTNSYQGVLDSMRIALVDIDDEIEKIIK